METLLADFPASDYAVVDVIVRRERRWTSASATPARELVRSTRQSERRWRQTKPSELSV
jgi:hypothetical protein